MTPDAEQKLRQFVENFDGRTRPLMLLDYDGTLAPFRVDRFKARPWAGAQELLKAIQKQARTHIVVITGRPAKEIAPMLGLEAPIEVWGLHGAERLYQDGRREVEKAEPATQAKLKELRSRLRKDSLGGLLEEKDNGVVMHWRGMPARKARLVEERTRALFEPLAKLDGLALLKFEAGLELRVGRDKGGAVKAILNETGDHSPVAFLGDDVTDEKAFQVVNALGPRGLSVLVRRAWRETEAKIWLRPPVDLLIFLRRWLDAA